MPAETISFPSVGPSDTPIKEIGFSVRPWKALIFYLGPDATLTDVSHLTEPQILIVPNCGIRSFREIQETLELYGLKLGTPPLHDEGRIPWDKLKGRSYA